MHQDTANRQHASLGITRFADNAEKSRPRYNPHIFVPSVLA
jgi:hypothetical protein